MYKDINDKNKPNTNIINICLVLVSLLIVFYILYIWSSFIIPFVIAFFLAFFLNLTYNFFKKHLKSSILSYILSIIVYGFIFWLVYSIINSNINDIIEKAPSYQTKLRSIIDTIVAKIWIQEWEIYKEIWGHINIQSIFSYIASLITNIFSSAWIITFYLVFILLEYKYIDQKLDLMIKDELKQKKLFEVIQEIKKDIKSYFIIKTFISFISASLSYIFMLIVWIDFALFWAFLMFILNFIPNIWSIISIAFPIILSIIQFNNFSYFIFVWLWLILIDALVSSIIDPKLTWSKLNLSPLVILMSLVFWSLIWWIVWAILSVPIMVVLSIVFSKFPQTRWIAILFSEKWEVKWIDFETEFKNNQKQLLDKIRNVYLNLRK